MQDTSSTVDGYTEQTVILTIFDYILHFNHRTTVNEQLRQLFYRFKPLAFYKAQLVIEKELTMIKLLLKIRKKQTPPLRVHDLNRYLESYPIPCRLYVRFGVFFAVQTSYFRFLYLEILSMNYVV